MALVFCASSPTARGGLGSTVLARAQSGQRESISWVWGAAQETEQGAWHRVVLTLCPTAQRLGSRAAGQRRAAAAEDPAWPWAASVMAPMTAGMALMKTQNSAVSISSPGAGGSSWAEGLSPWDHGVARGWHELSQLYPRALQLQGQNHPAGFAQPIVQPLDWGWLASVRVSLLSLPHRVLHLLLLRGRSLQLGSGGWAADMGEEHKRGPGDHLWCSHPGSQHQQCHRCVLAVGPPCLPPSFFLLPLCPRAQPCSEPSWCLLRLFSPHHCWGGCQRGQAEQPHFPGHQLLLRESLWALMCRAGDSSPTGMVGVRDRDPCMGSVLPRLFVWGGRWV